MSPAVTVLTNFWSIFHFCPPNTYSFFMFLGGKKRNISLKWVKFGPHSLQANTLQQVFFAIEALNALSVNLT